MTPPLCLGKSSNLAWTTSASDNIRECPPIAKVVQPSVRHASAVVSASKAPSKALAR